MPHNRPPDADRYLIERQPYYLSRGDEISFFQNAYDVRLPVMLKGPTGCGKTRFVEFMACRAAICLPLTDDRRLQETFKDLIDDIF